MKKGSGNKGKKGLVADIVSKRREVVRVKTTAKRSKSSAVWLARQLNDPYVAAAKEQGYRSRAAFKLLQLNERFALLKSGQKVVDLGAAPGGWTQVAVKEIGSKGKLVAIDLLDMEPVPGALILTMDFLAPEAPEALMKLLDGAADLVLSDMAPATTGHARTDHVRIMGLAEAAAAFAVEILAPGGAFVCKLFQGGAEKELLDFLKKEFASVRHAKPNASRADSSESYIVATGFRKKSVSR